MRRRVASIVVVMLGVVLAAPAAVSGVDPGAIRAELAGRPIPPAEVGTHHCHDLDYPLIRCFGSRVEVERAVSQRAGAGAATPSSAPSDATTLAVSYVRVFADRNYGGASLYVSQAYDHLGTIGWNDRISSFQALTAAGGRFYRDAYGGGWTYSFCCSQNVAYVGDSYNDQFSAVYPT